MGQDLIGFLCSDYHFHKEYCTCLVNRMLQIQIIEINNQNSYLLRLKMEASYGF